MELNRRKDVFKLNDYFYFAYFVRRRNLDKTIVLKAQGCIYYMIILIFPKKVEALDMDELINNVKRDAKDFAKEVASKSGVDLEKEEFIGVENIIKVDDLERELEEKNALIKEQQERILKLEEENRKLKRSKKK